MKLRKNVEQLATEYVAREGIGLDNNTLRKGYLAGARDMLEVISEIVFDKGYNKIPRLHDLIMDLEGE